MGCWKATCGLSNLPINENMEVVACLISVSRDEKAISVISPCFIGKYNDYGGIRNIVENEATKFIAQWFELYSMKEVCEKISNKDDDSGYGLIVPHYLVSYHKSVLQNCADHPNFTKLTRKQINQHKKDLAKYESMPDRVYYWMCRKDYLDRMMAASYKHGYYDEEPYALNDRVDEDMKDVIEAAIGSVSNLCSGAVSDDRDRTDKLVRFSVIQSTLYKRFKVSGKYNRFSQFMEHQYHHRISIGELINDTFYHLIETVIRDKNDAFIGDCFSGLNYLEAILRLLLTTGRQLTTTTAEGLQDLSMEPHIQSAKVIIELVSKK